MTKIEHLRKLLDGNEEALGLLDSIAGELNDSDDAEKELAEAQVIVDKWDALEFDPNGLKSVNLGLDTLHYRLENGNLLIQQRLEDALKEINTIGNAEIIF